MFDKPSIEDMKARPNLREEERVLEVVTCKLGDVLRDNVVVAVTTDRIIVNPKRGRSVDEEYANLSEAEIPLEGVDAVRRTGAITKTLEIVRGEDVHKLPPLQQGSEDIITALQNELNLRQTEWGKQSLSTRGSKILIAGSIGIVGLVVGVLSMVAGILLVLTIIGIIPGILLALGGGVVAVGSYQLTVWAFNKEEEWNPSEEVAERLQDPTQKSSPKRDTVSSSEAIGEPDISEQTAEHPSEPGKVFYLLNKFANFYTQTIGSFRAGFRASVPSGIWSYGVLLGTLLWLSLFGLVEFETLFGLVLFIAWPLLPISIFIDSKEIQENTDWKPRTWVYLLISIVPIAAILGGIVWLVFRKRTVGSFFSY